MVDSLYVLIERNGYPSRGQAPEIYATRLKIREEDKLSMAKVAKRFGVDKASVMRWSNELEPKQKRNKPATKIDMKSLARDVEMYPDAYLKERAEKFNVSHNCIWHALKRLKVSYKYLSCVAS